MIRLFLMLLLFLSTHVSAADLTLVEEYLEASGTKRIIIELPKHIEKGYMEQKQETLKHGTILKSFNADAALGYVREQIAQNIDDNMLYEIIAYYKSPIGKKFKENGFFAVNALGSEKYTTFMTLVKKYPPSYERIRLTSELVEQLDFVPISVHFMGEFLGKINADMKTGANRQISENILMTEIQNHLYSMALFAFGDCKIDELKEMIQFYASAQGKAEQKIVSTLFKQLISETFTELADASQPKPSGK